MNARTFAIAAGLASMVYVGCDQGKSGDANGATVAISRMIASIAAVVASVNDATEARQPVLSPDEGRAIVERELESVGGTTVSPQSAPNYFHCRTGIGSKETIRVDLDMQNMIGDVSIDTPRWLLRAPAVRRIRVHAAPHAATYTLLFSGYEPSDKTPSGESFTPDQSIIARIVPVLDDMRIYFDGEFTPPVPPPAGFFLCEQ